MVMIVSRLSWLYWGLSGVWWWQTGESQDDDNGLLASSQHDDDDDKFPRGQFCNLKCTQVWRRDKKGWLPNNIHNHHYDNNYDFIIILILNNYHHYDKNQYGKDDVNQGHNTYIRQTRTFHEISSKNIYTRSLGPLRRPTSSWRPFGPLDIVRAFRPECRARLRSGPPFFTFFTILTIFDNFGPFETI